MQSQRDDLMHNRATCLEHKTRKLRQVMFKEQYKARK